MGRAKVQFFEGGGKHGSDNYWAEEIYIEELVYLYGSCESSFCIIIPNGQHLL